MLVTAALLAVYVVIINLVNGREKRLSLASTMIKAEAEKPLGKEGAFKLVVGRRYLLLIALLLVILNLVNTTGEFILGKTVTKRAQELSASQHSPVRATGAAPTVAQAESQKVAHAFIGEFYASFFFWVSLISAMVQLFLVSRIIKYMGVAVALFVLPVIALGGYSLVIFMPVLSFIMGAKIMENSVDYSLQNTCRQALFLPTSREEKYKAKAAIDTFFVRAGDVLSSLLVFIGVQLALDTGAMAKVNIAFVIVALLLVAGIGRHYQKLTAEPRPAV
jgi:AAA family ATP:ADP antiporter